MCEVVLFTVSQGLVRGLVRCLCLYSIYSVFTAVHCSSDDATMHSGQAAKGRRSSTAEALAILLSSLAAP